MTNDEKSIRARANVQSYVERIRRQSRRYAEQLFHELERLRDLTATLEKEQEALREQNRDYRAHADEAQRLRAECARLMNDNAHFGEELRVARERIQSFAEEREALRRRLADIEAESSRYAMQYLDVEQQNTVLANLYVTIHQLHSTLDRDEVLTGIKEIIINLIGSEELAIFERAGARLTLAGSFGIDEQSLATWPLDRGGWIAQAVNENEIFIRNGETAAIAQETHLTACVPLRRGPEVTGAVAVFRLLQQKPALQSVDHELFDLLSVHGGMALYATSLHAERESMPLVQSEVV